ncbi:GntR family transcriptional regulator [Parapusillimonas granuli]|uniref:GntR family transcriptional regulator n=1 Tax=Parapusillimonas granuli TaxID=380911 RepID=A0A853G2Y8_9BURK|nr:GntR family transcriptional regulator [Parapusillimonas granuli]MBB5216036.1 DNA-binding GntR family transcriptional regulator [Parapusillimonas granuli]MEB2401308.1 GntR family transcriptional regulator [Alcaligenaceae bacterium]NYT50669.1 GntR family transcriptional regulator [Parapusillimonas granuli]
MEPIKPQAAVDVRQRLSVDEIMRRLEDLILKGDYGPGARLPEQALADALGIGRGPLREAIRTLEGRRLLERVPHAGVRVVDLSVEDMDQILTVRESLEGMASRLAAEYMTLPEVRRLRAITAGLEHLGSRDMEAVFKVDSDQDFHRTIVLGSRNKWITNLLCRDLYTLLRLCRMRSGQLRRDMGRIHQEHHAIVDCIERRDPDGAERLMRAHVRESRERLLAALRGPNPSPPAPR